MVQDLATQWLQSYPCKTNSPQGTGKSSRKFLEPSEKPNVTNTDNSLESGKACEELSWNHCKSTPRRSETNGIAERAVRRIKGELMQVVLQSGLDEKWWADSMGCYCYLRNVQDFFCEGKTPFERRCGEARNDFVDDRWELCLSVICTERRIIPNTTSIFLTWSGEQILSWTCC